VRVLLAADDDCVDGNEYTQDTCQRSLHDDKYETSNGLGGLAHAQLFDKDQDTDDGEHANNRDGDVDPGARLERVWTSPQKHDEHKGFNNELTGRLGKTVAISSCNDATTKIHQ